MEEQKSSGLNVQDWCTQNGIKVKTYYYHLRRVREELSNRSRTENKQVQNDTVRAVVPIPTVPAKFHVRRHIVKVYKCTKCGSDPERDAELDDIEPCHFRKADCPKAMIPGSYCSPELLAHIIYEKYGKAVPLHRQEKDFFSKRIPLLKATMSNWVMTGAEQWCLPIIEKMRELLFAANIAAIVSLPKYTQKPHITRLKSQGGYSAVMLFHQLHYFFYAHITLAAVSFAISREQSPFGFLDYAFECNPQICGIAIGALLFCGTWITYMSVEPIVSRLTKNVTTVFYTGHSIICLLLLVMSQFTAGALFILLWLLTGLGGGTVYTISERAGSKGKYDKSSMTVSENLGHTFGLLSAVVIAAFLGNAAPSVMLVCGSASAFLAILCMTLIIRKEKQHESIKDNG